MFGKGLKNTYMFGNGLKGKSTISAQCKQNRLYALMALPTLWRLKYAQTFRQNGGVVMQVKLLSLPVSLHMKKGAFD